MRNKLPLTLNTTGICTAMNGLVKTFVYRKDCDAKEKRKPGQSHGRYLILERL